MTFSTKPRVIYNDDTCSLRTIEPPHAVEQVSRALDYLADSQVDCLCWCMSTGDIAYSWPSEVMENAFDLAEKDAGVEMARMSTESNLLLSLHREGVDYLPHLIDLAHQRGISFFGSFRMNDAHHKSRPHGMLASEFWKSHQEWRLWEVTDGRTYYNACLDYSFPEVRQLRLDAIREVAGLYDLDGIELDWCRNPFAFQPSEAWEKRHILTDFTREVRALLAELGAKRGREIGLIIRVPAHEDKRRRGGIDAEAWVEQGLMDALVVSTLFNNYDEDFSPWVDLCRHHGVLLYPSVEAGPAHNAAHNHVTPETAREIISRTAGAAQNYLSQEPDGLYLFNYPCRLFEREWTDEEFDELALLLSDVGDRDSLRGRRRQYTFWQGLPIQIEASRPPEFHQTVAFTVRDPAVAAVDTRVTIRYRQVTERNPHATEVFEQGPTVAPGWVEVILNGVAVPEGVMRRTAQPAGKIPSGFEIGEHELVEVEPPPGMLADGKNTLAFRIPRYPSERDPYIHIYELVVDVQPAP